MTIFIIFCILCFISGLLLIGIWNGARDDRSSYLESKPAAAYIVSILGGLFNTVVIVCTTYDFHGAIIVSTIITLWLLITSGMNGLEPFICYVVFMFFPFVPFMHWEETPYKACKTGNTWVLRHPATYWITHHTEAEGVDTFRLRLKSRRGGTYDTPIYAEVTGLKDSVGRLYIPKICTYDDGFTEVSVEPYDGEPSSTGVFKLRRPDGTVKRLDINGRNADSKHYNPPTFQDDPNAYRVD